MSTAPRPRAWCRPTKRLLARQGAPIGAREGAVPQRVFEPSSAVPRSLRLWRGIGGVGAKTATEAADAPAGRATKSCQPIDNVLFLFSWWESER